MHSVTTTHADGVFSAVCICGWKAKGRNEDRIERKVDAHLTPSNPMPDAANDAQRKAFNTWLAKILPYLTPGGSRQFEMDGDILVAHVTGGNPTGTGAGGAGSVRILPSGEVLTLGGTPVPV